MWYKQYNFDIITLNKIYSDSFKKLVKEWIKKYPDRNDLHSYIGVGNPNAKILLVGKEGAKEETVEEIEKKETAFAHYWLDKINSNQQGRISDYYPVSDKGNVSNGHTWVKY